MKHPNLDTREGLIVVLRYIDHFKEEAEYFAMHVEEVSEALEAEREGRGLGYEQLQEILTELRSTSEYWVALLGHAESNDWDWPPLKPADSLREEALEA